jgi:predicted nuclease of predicted toxin-antitoxin system
VRILLDECLPKRLKRDLVGHEARTVPDMGWASKRNGELLVLAEAQFDVFLTVDRNLSFQQNVKKSKLAVVVMVAKTNRHSGLKPLISQVLTALSTVAPGQVIKVGA